MLKLLGDICLVKRGTTITQKEATQGNIPVVAGGLKPTYFHNVSNRQGNVITISGSGANAGFVNFWDEPIFASDCSTVEVKRDDLSVHFVYYFLLSQQDFIYKELRSGAAQPHVYGKDIAKLLMPFPSLAIQQEIVIKLDAIFAEIDRAVLATEANVKNAEALFKSYLTEAFDFSENDLVKLSSITTDITDGDHQPPPKATEGVPFITISNVDKETRLIDFSQTFKVSREYFESLKENRKPKNGDVLYTVTGSFGIPIHVNDDVEFCFQRHIGLLRPSEKVSSKWLYWLMLSPQIFQQAKNSATGAAQLTVSLKAIRNFMVPSISLDEQLKVVKHLDECFSIYTNLRNSYLKKIKAINASKNLFLKQAFNGELVKD